MGLTDYLGKKRRLMIVKEVEFGVYLGNKDDKVLLPKKQVPKDVEVGDPVEVFLYKDSSDRLIATTQEPKITLDELAVLKVADTGRIGAFLDWGLEKDLLLPFKEQTAKVKKGDEVLVALYVDKSGRLCATMKVYEQENRFISQIPAGTGRGTAKLPHAAGDPGGHIVQRFGRFLRQQGPGLC